MINTLHAFDYSLSKNDFLNQFKFLRKEIKDSKVFESIKKSKLDLYIYGFGNMANQITYKLQNNNISYKGFIVDKEFDSVKKEGVFYWEDFDKTSKINIIMGFANYKNKIEYVKNLMFVNDFFIISCPYDHHNNISKQNILNNISKYKYIYDSLYDNLSKISYIAYLKARSTKDNAYVCKVASEATSEFINDIFKAEQNLVMVDVGAYDGSGILRYIEEVKKYKHIYGIEAETNNFRMLRKTIKYHNLENIDLFNVGVWSSNTKIKFNLSDNKCCRFDNNSINEIEVKKLDDLLLHCRVDLISIGISSGLFEILSGAEKLILNNNPDLIIFAGASSDDFYDLIKFLLKCNPNYRFFMRFQSPFVSRLFLYVIDGRTS